jgi:23S rRNA A2030 N6-methylase RlmJ
MPSDRQADWDRLLDEISENDNVTVSLREDGYVQIAWTLPPQD